MTEPKDPNQKGKVIQGPWKEKTADISKNNKELTPDILKPDIPLLDLLAEGIKSREEKTGIANEEVRKYMKEFTTGQNESFKKILKEAQESGPFKIGPSQNAIQEEKMKIRNLNKRQLLLIINSEKNHEELKQNPALIVAIYQLFQEIK